MHRTAVRLCTNSILLVALMVLAGNTSMTISGDAGSIPLMQPAPWQTMDPSTLPAWKLIDPYNPSRPLLFATDGKSFHLAPEWSVERIESVYSWQGGPKNVYRHQIVESQGTGYRRGQEDVPGQLVAELLGAMTNLYPTHTWLAGTDEVRGWLDWSVELTGKDAQRILLVSSSLRFPAMSPWNVYYNGRLYVQYDGALGAVLNKLFPDENRPGNASKTGMGTSNPDAMLFRAMGIPAQLSEGFVGLLPIADAFSPTVDQATGEVTGTIKGKRSLDRNYYGYDRILGTVDQVRSVELLEDADHPIPCALTSTGNKEEERVLWTFKCVLTTVPTGAYYDIPIRVSLDTMYESGLQTEGRLLGKLREKDSYIFIPPVEVQQILSETPAAVDLLSDHVLYGANYSVVANRRRVPKYDDMLAEAAFLGQTKIGSVSIRYRVTTLFTLKEGKVATWTLTRPELDRMIEAIAGMALTQRLVKAIPDLVLDMEYFNGEEPNDLAYIDLLNFIYYSGWYTPCGAQDTVTLLGTREPLRAFTLALSDFTLSYRHRDPAYVFWNNVPTPYALQVVPGPNDPTGLSRQLTTANGKTFARIRVLSGTHEPALALEIGDGVDQETRATLRKLAETLPGALYEAKDKPYVHVYDVSGEYWLLEGATLAMTEDGSLRVEACHSARPTATPPPPTNTPNPTPAESAQAADPSALDAWTFYDPADPRRPSLISKNGNTYRLNPDWEVARAEYVYKWWGLSPAPRFDYQVLELGATGYQIGSKKIDPALVRKLIGAIANLQPSSSIVAGQDHTDDYPLWHLELTGKDGQRIILVSFSTANPGAAPWNVVYNARIYAQFDGPLGTAIGSLFSSDRGNPSASFFPGGREPGTVIFGTTGLPAQLSIGFVGLLPIADGFYYRIDRDALQIQGYIQGRSSIAGLGNMVIGSITRMVSVDLFPQGGKTIHCILSTVSSSDPSSAEWDFTCPLESAPLNSFYDYPIKVTFGTDKGQEVSTEGRLQGKITDKQTVFYIPPLEVQQILMANSAAAADLFADHLLYYASYDAVWETAGSKMKQMSGEAILLGQTQIGVQRIRYTIGTPFAIDDGKVSYWTLTRAAVQKMIKQITDLALTQRIYAQAPDVTLNLWYSERGEIPQVMGLLGNHAPRYDAQMTACGDPPRVVLPAEEPFRAFGFGGDWSLHEADFVLVKDQVVVNELDLWPRSDTREGALPLLVPRQLNWGSGTPFRRIQLNRTFGEFSLDLSIDEHDDPRTVDALRNIVTALPGTADFKYQTLWVVTGVTIRVASDGSLEVISCLSK